ncbi:hypothetical protein [Frankia sp. Cr2]|uniref:hypothetical protein n=1 Tax=Frankia sp. Cr2 TaxID=3073932 RepID=UPI002AD31598|nr:hypothetical protein [Frankia sp. Cr2]
MNTGEPGRQFTERYANTFHQLNIAALDIRLGEIYALERLAKDSPEEQPAIIGILAAFVCIRLASRSDIGPDRPDQPWCTRTAWACGQGLRVSGRMGRDADIQAALTVFGRLSPPPGTVR